jgi:aminopeptidase YwaD
VPASAPEPRGAGARLRFRGGAGGAGCAILAAMNPSTGGVGRRAAGAGVVLLLSAGALLGQAEAPPPLLPEATVAALASEVSGTAARRTVQEISLFHRMRGSRGFKAAADRIAEQARSYGLAVEVISLPADGAIYYGTQRSRPAWDVDSAELWEQRRGPAADAAVVAGSAGSAGSAGGMGGVGGSVAAGGWSDAVRIASWETRPLTLAQDSASGAATADLVDVGAGTAAADYAGRDLHGKLALASAQPGAVAHLAVERYGAVGIVSYAQNQPTAWSGEDENLVRWGHLDTFPPPHTFAFMVSLKQARAWQARLAAGDTVRLRAAVRAAQHPGSYDIVTATIPGADPAVAADEIVLSCHLDHPRPAANDNASGCATILEVARTLARLIQQHRLAPPRRTLRFVWPPEMEGTIALLNARPDIASHARAVVHMDMVGGDAAATGAVFHVTRSPRSLPTFVNDVGEAFLRYVNAQSDAYASTGVAAHALADPEGTKYALQGAAVAFTPGSDHEVWSEGSFRVPAIYMNDWPDRYIHTTGDLPANIDPTKLLRAAFLGAASAYYLAQLDDGQVPPLLALVERHAIERLAAAQARRDELLAAAAAGDRDIAAGDAATVLPHALRYEQAAIDSIAAFAPLPPATRAAAADFLTRLRQLAAAPAAPAAPPSSGPPAAAASVDAASTAVAANAETAAAAARAETAVAANAETAATAARVYTRAPSPRGPMTGFGYSYYDDRAAAQKLAPPALATRHGRWGSDYTYEALNMVDGQRTVSDIRDALTATLGPVPLAEVAAYLADLARIGILATR